LNDKTKYKRASYDSRESQTPIKPVGEFHLLAMGINHYDDPDWKTLKGPLNDVAAICALMELRYGFKKKNITIIPETEATNDQFINCLRQYGLFKEAKKKLGENDSLLIWIAGHGELDKHDDGSSSGYFIPKDGPANYSFKHWLDYNAVNKTIQKINARHILLVSDSCFAAEIFSGKRSSSDNVEYHAKEKMKWPSRRAMTSGGYLQMVNDVSHTGDMHSIFALTALHILEHNTLSHFDSSRLCSEIEEAIDESYEQTPLENKLPSLYNELGRFVFILSQKKGDLKNREKYYLNIAKGERVGQPRFTKQRKFQGYLSIIITLILVIIAIIFLYKNYTDGDTIGTTSNVPVDSIRTVTGLTDNEAWSTLENSKMIEPRVRALEHLTWRNYTVDRVDFSCGYYGGVIIADPGYGLGNCEPELRIDEMNLERSALSRGALYSMFGLQDDRQLANCNFSGSMIFGFKISLPLIKGCKFDYIKFNFGNFENSNITDSSFRKAYFFSINFTNTSIINSTLEGARAGNSNFSNAKFIDVDFTDFYFGHSNISGMSITGAKTIGFNESQLQEAWAWADNKPKLPGDVTPSLCDPKFRNNEYPDHRPKECE